MVVEKPDMQGMRSYRMRVADLPFDCILPEVIRIEEVLPSCIPFVQEHPVGDAAFVWEAVPEMEEEATGELLEEFRNDMGKVRLFRNGTIFRIAYKLYLAYPSGISIFINSSAESSISPRRSTANFLKAAGSPSKSILKYFSPSKTA